MSFATQIFIREGVKVVGSEVIEVVSAKNPASINRIPILTVELPGEHSAQGRTVRIVGFHGTLDHSGPDVLNAELKLLQGLLSDSVETYIIGDFNLLGDYRDQYIMQPTVFKDLATFACFHGDHLPSKVIEMLEKAGIMNVFEKFPDGSGRVLSQLDGFFTNSKAQMNVKLLNPITLVPFKSREEQFEFFKGLANPGAEIVSDHFPIVVEFQ